MCVCQKGRGAVNSSDVGGVSTVHSSAPSVKGFAKIKTKQNKETNIFSLPNDVTSPCGQVQLYMPLVWRFSSRKMNEVEWNLISGAHRTRFSSCPPLLWIMNIVLFSEQFPFEVQNSPYIICPFQAF